MEITLIIANSDSQLEKNKLELIQEIEAIKESKNSMVQNFDYDNAAILRDKEVQLIKKLGEMCEKTGPTWHTRDKTYISDFMDEDIKNSPLSNVLDRVLIKNTQLSTKKSVEDFIQFLENVKESLKS